MSEFDQLDNQFREFLSDAEVTPPAASWNGIESQLKRKNRKRGLVMFLSGLSLVAITLGLILNFSIYKPKNSSSVKPNSANEKSTSPEKLTQKTSQVRSKKEVRHIEPVSPIDPTTEVIQLKQESNKQEPIINENEKPQELVVEDETINKLSLKSMLTRSILELPIKPFNGRLLNNRKEDYVKPKWNLKIPIIAGIEYSPLFSPSDVVNSNVIPINSVVISDNLVDQRLVNFEATNEYSHKFGFYGGIQISKNISLLTGFNFSKWCGNAQLYLDNTYEHSTTYTEEVVEVQTIIELIELTESGTVTDKKEVESYIQTQNPKEGFIIPNGTFTGNTTTVSPNEPTYREITRTETTVTYEEITVVENLTYADTVQSHYCYSYFEIPLNLRYQLGTKKLKGFATAGVSVRFGNELSLQSVTVSQNDLAYSKQERIPYKQQWNASFRGGILFNPSPKIELHLSPGVQWNLSEEPLNPERNLIYDCTIGIGYIF